MRLVVLLMYADNDLTACNGTEPLELTANSGTIQSPWYTTYTYPNNARCQWRVTASAGDNVRVARFWSKRFGGLSVHSLKPSLLYVKLKFHGTDTDTDTDRDAPIV